MSDTAALDELFAPNREALKSFSVISVRAAEGNGIGITFTTESGEQRLALTQNEAIEIYSVLGRAIAELASGTPM